MPEFAPEFIPVFARRLGPSLRPNCCETAAQLCKQCRDLHFGSSYANRNVRLDYNAISDAAARSGCTFRCEHDGTSNINNHY